MTDQHRATPEQWANMKEYQDDGLDDGYGSCIIELRARIEALEAAQLEQAESHRFCTDAIVRRVEALEDPMTELRAASAEARPAGLVERVADVLGHLGVGTARAAIREVAAWLTENYAKDVVSPPPGQMLRDEANRG
jgi:hypothetical protein